MTAIQVVASIVDEASGPSYSVPKLAAALARQGRRSKVYSVGPALSVGAPPQPKAEVSVGSGCEALTFAHDFSRVPIIGRLAISRALSAALNEAAAKGAVLHSHGLWLMPNVYAGWEARRHARPLIVAPRGMLGTAALAFSPTKKRLMWTLLQRSALAGVTCYHATSEQEVEDIRAFGLKGPVAVIPNGIDVPPACQKTPRAPEEPRTVLHLGRIHPKKGIDRLLYAWGRTGAKRLDWRLRIIGPSELGHSADLQVLARRLEFRNVTFEEPHFGNDKLAAYRDADVFVLPSLHENFGMVVAEALAAGTPVISTVGAPWQGLHKHGCGWWVEHGAEPMAAALTAAMEMSPEALAGMGERGRDWMLRNYSWDRVATDMLAVYAWCESGGHRPATVVVD